MTKSETSKYISTHLAIFSKIDTIIYISKEELDNASKYYDRASYAAHRITLDIIKHIKLVMDNHPKSRLRVSHKTCKFGYLKELLTLLRMKELPKLGKDTDKLLDLFIIDPLFHVVKIKKGIRLYKALEPYLHVSKKVITKDACIMYTPFDVKNEAILKQYTLYAYSGDSQNELTIEMHDWYTTIYEYVLRDQELLKPFL